jgi:phosphoribosylanthranilate isomerase
MKGMPEIVGARFIAPASPVERAGRELGTMNRAPTDEERSYPAPLVKICGVREPAHARVAVEAGADLIGVVFYPPSHRNVTVDDAHRVAEAARQADPSSRVKLVGLFVNETIERMNAVAELVGLDLIQLSGDESSVGMSNLERPVIATLRIDSSGRLDEEARFQELTSAPARPWAILLDSHVRGMYGGTGTVADWFVAADFARRHPVILAGGLRSETVAEAITRVKPFAVDVSSGVETDKRKDVAKIRAFITAAKGEMRDEAGETSVRATR